MYLHIGFFVCILFSFLYPLYCLSFIYHMIATIFIIVLVLLFPLFFPGYYVSELFLSFLPYIVAMSGIFVIVTFVNFRKKMKSVEHSPVRRYFRGISFLVFCLLFFLYSKQFNNFYVQEPIIQESTTWSLKIFYANIHKDNTEYQEIKNLITENDPDILMFVEFADHHYDNLKQFLEKYPYTNNTTRSKTFVGSMVFSKYPISNKADDFPQWMRKYGYFSIPYNNQEIYFYLVHTSSPDSYNHFLMRNEQLTTFVKNFNSHESDRKHDNIVAIGDFNVTPWSSYYDILSTTFSGKLLNITRRIPFLFTRRLRSLPIVQAHIDHLWTTPSLTTQNFESISMPWSDHKAFLFTVQINTQ